MLKKINGFARTAEAAEIIAAIDQRASGAALFSRQPMEKPSPQSPSL